MKRMEANIRKLKKGIDDSFRARNIVSGRGNTPNSTCSQGQKVEVDYFALTALIEFYEETRVAVRNVIVAREALAHLYWSKNPLPD